MSFLGFGTNKNLFGTVIKISDCLLNSVHLTMAQSYLKMIDIRLIHPHEIRFAEVFELLHATACCFSVAYNMKFAQMVE